MIAGMPPQDDIAGVVDSHRRLLDTLDRLDDETAQAPSLLPGWDVAMLVTHLARNADSHSGMLEAAARGEQARQYPSLELRDAAIDEGRGRPAAEVVDDLRASVDRLEGLWQSLPADAWARDALTTGGDPNPIADLPFQRWREVEVHHADLGLGFTTGEWDSRYVAAELEASVALLAARLPVGTGILLRASDSGREWTVPAGGRVTAQVESPAHALLAWLLGRDTSGFPELAPWQWAPRR